MLRLPARVDEQHAGTAILMLGNSEGRASTPETQSSRKPIMSCRTEDWNGPGKAFVINDAIAYLDSLTLFFWQPPGADLLGALRKAYQRRLIVKAYEVPGRGFAARGRRHRSKRWHVTIHQPGPETLEILST